MSGVRLDDCTALIVAGGESRRMGQDKATLALNSTNSNDVMNAQPLVDELAHRLQPFFAQLLVSVRAPRAEIRWPQVFDDPALMGPLAGLKGGLRVCSTPWLFALAVDMPFIDPATILRLAELRNDVDAVVPCSEGVAQPLAAFYSRSCLTRIDELTAQPDGRRSLRAMLEGLRVRYVDAADLGAAEKVFVDLDTPEDVRKYGFSLTDKVQKNF